MGERVWPSPERAPGDEVARLRAVRVRNSRGEVTDSVDIREPITVEIEYWSNAVETRPAANLHFWNDQGACLFATAEFSAPGWGERPRPHGVVVRAVCRVPGNFFAEGRVILRYAAVTSYNPTALHALERDAISFQVVDHSQGDGARGPYGGEWPGVMRPLLEWQSDVVD
jgi:lipopolysaccharide transport system ATP-binding protein